MKTTQYSEIVYDENDLCDLVMQGHDVANIDHIIVDPTVNLERVAFIMEDPSQLLTWTFPTDSDISVAEFDAIKQSHWFMPDAYKELDIAEYVLGLCLNDAELQRCGQELMMFQERNLFDLLKYLKYLVDVMNENRMIWGVGRGSSVASFVLYKLGVHRIDSLFYDLDPSEFLR